MGDGVSGLGNSKVIVSGVELCANILRLAKDIATASGDLAIASGFKCGREISVSYKFMDDILLVSLNGSYLTESTFAVLFLQTFLHIAFRSVNYVTNVKIKLITITDMIRHRKVHLIASLFSRAPSK